MPGLSIARKFGQSVVVIVPSSTEQQAMVITLEHHPRRGKQMLFDGSKDIQVYRSEIAHAVMGGEAPQHVDIARSEIAKQEASK